MGLSLLSYAVNLFIFSIGSLFIDKPPILRRRRPARPRALHRSGAAGARAHGHRHQLRDDGALPRRAARLARADAAPTTSTAPRHERRSFAARCRTWSWCPIVLPLLAAAVMLLLGERRSGRSSWCIGVDARALAGRSLILGGARWLGGRVRGRSASTSPGNWQAPFGIVLAADRLSALMLVLTWRRWDLRAAVRRGALAPGGRLLPPALPDPAHGPLTAPSSPADLFNLFVFFEVMLAASYGLLLHGSGWPRVRAGCTTSR